MPRKGENITKRKDGRWEARIIRGYNENGKALYKFMYGHSYAEVKAKKEEALSALKTERVVIKSSLTYDAVLTAFLLNRKNAVKESTYAHYCDIVDTHIRPYLGYLKMKQLCGAVIDRFTNDMLNHGRRDGKGGLAAKSVKDMLSIIRLSFKYAVKEKILSPEAIAFSSPKVENKDIQVLSLPEQKRLETISVFPCAYPAIGDCKRRAELIAFLEKEKFQVPRLIHPSSTVSPSAVIENAVIVEANATINAMAHIKKGCILSSNTLIDRGAVVSEAVHVDSSSTVGKDVFVPPLTKIESGTVYTGIKA